MFPTALSRNFRSNLRTAGLQVLRAARTALQQQFGADVPVPTPARRWTVEGLEDRVLLSSIAGAVFVGTNHNNTKATNPNEPANQVVMYNRLDDGTLDLVGRFNTGGQGSGPSVRFAGDGLGSSHSVQLSQDNKFLFVTNAGSDNISVFKVSPTGLQLVDLEPTGDFPNSVTQHGNRVYVLNGSGRGTIGGYEFNTSTGQLSPLSNSTRILNANQDPTRPDTLFNPAQVSFTPDGKQLVVTIKDGPAAGAIPGVTPTGPGRILTFGVDANGRPAAVAKRLDVNNRGPFGFSFDKKGNMLTALFVGGPNLTGAAGSFKINGNGTVTPISATVPNGQLDSCWIENNGTYAWTANYTSGNISTYRINSNGTLTLTQANAGQADDLPGDGVGKTQGATPLDINVTPNGKFLYDVLPGSGTVAAFSINADGSLVKLGEFGGLPETVNGDSAPFEFGPGGSPAGIDSVDYAKAIPVTPPSNVLYIETNDPRTGRNSILAYRRSPTTGLPTEQVAGSPFLTGGTGFFNNNDRIGPDDSDQEVVVTKDRRFLLAVNQGSNTVSVFRIAANGSLSLIPGAPFDAGGKQPVSIGLAANNTVVVVNKGDQNPGGSGGTNKPNYVSFKMRADGRLTKIAGATVTVGAGSSPTQALVSRDGKFVFGDNFLARQFTPPAGFPADLVPPFGSELESFRVGADGKLTRNMPAQPSQLPGVPDKYILNMQIHPTKNIVYTGMVVGNKLGVYTYDNNGVLKFVKAIPTTGAGLCWLVTNKAGTRLYGTNFATDSVAVFDISDPLNPVELQDLSLNGKNVRPPNQPSPAIFDTVAFQLSLSPDEKSLYILNHEQRTDNLSASGNHVNTLRVQPDGLLVETVQSPLVFPVATVPLGSHPQGVVAI